MKGNKKMQQITPAEAEELIFNHNIIERKFCQDEKVMRFYFILGNAQLLIVKYNHDTKEKSCFLKQPKSQFERSKYHVQIRKIFNCHYNDEYPVY